MNIQELVDAYNNLPPIQTTTVPSPNDYSVYSGITWFPPPLAVCPGCGRCNTCGRKDAAPVQPVWPNYEPWRLFWEIPMSTSGSSTSGSLSKI